MIDARIGGCTRIGSGISSQRCIQYEMSSIMCLLYGQPCCITKYVTYHLHACVRACVPAPNDQRTNQSMTSCVCVATHSSFFDHIKDILHLVDSTDVEVQKYTSLVLQNLASNELMWPPLIEHGITYYSLTTACAVAVAVADGVCGLYVMLL